MPITNNRMTISQALAAVGTDAKGAQARYVAPAGNALAGASQRPRALTTQQREQMAGTLSGMIVREVRRSARWAGMIQANPHASDTVEQLAAEAVAHVFSEGDTTNFSVANMEQLSSIAARIAGHEAEEFLEVVSSTPQAAAALLAERLKDPEFLMPPPAPRSRRVRGCEQVCASLKGLGAGGVELATGLGGTIRSGADGAWEGLVGGGRALALAGTYVPAGVGTVVGAVAGVTFHVFNEAPEDRRSTYVSMGAFLGALASSAYAWSSVVFGGKRGNGIATALLMGDVHEAARRKLARAPAKSLGAETVRTRLKQILPLSSPEELTLDALIELFDIRYSIRHDERCAAAAADEIMLAMEESGEDHWIWGSLQMLLLNLHPDILANVFLTPVQLGKLMAAGQHNAKVDAALTELGQQPGGVPFKDVAAANQEQGKDWVWAWVDVFKVLSHNARRFEEFRASPQAEKPAFQDKPLWEVITQFELDEGLLQRHDLPAELVALLGENYGFPALGYTSDSHESSDGDVPADAADLAHSANPRSSGDGPEAFPAQPSIVSRNERRAEKRRRKPGGNPSTSPAELRRRPLPAGRSQRLILRLIEGPVWHPRGASNITLCRPGRPKKRETCTPSARESCGAILKP